MTRNTFTRTGQLGHSHATSSIPNFYSNITNYDIDPIAQNCWLGAINVALPDLDTEREDVVQMTGDWIKSTLSNYSADALRIDAAKHVNTGFLPPFVKAANIFTMGEVYS